MSEKMHVQVAVPAMFLLFATSMITCVHGGWFSDVLEGAKVIAGAVQDVSQTVGVIQNMSSSAKPVSEFQGGNNLFGDLVQALKDVEPVAQGYAKDLIGLSDNSANDFWSTVGSIGQTVAPLLPLLLAGAEDNASSSFEDPDLYSYLSSILQSAGVLPLLQARLHEITFVASGSPCYQPNKDIVQSIINCAFPPLNKSEIFEGKWFNYTIGIGLKFPDATGPNECLQIGRAMFPIFAGGQEVEAGHGIFVGAMAAKVPKSILALGRAKAVKMDTVHNSPSQFGADWSAWIHSGTAVLHSVNKVADIVDELANNPNFADRLDLVPMGNEIAYTFESKMDPATFLTYWRGKINSAARNNQNIVQIINPMASLPNVAMAGTIGPGYLPIM